MIQGDTGGGIMGLKVIGTGFGRTGTHSLKIALEMLGLNPCYHMMEVFAHPDHIPVWDGLAAGTRDDFDTALAGHPATVDWPTTFFWRELMRRNPSARILHSERPAEEWWQSISRTIFDSLVQPVTADAPPWMANFKAMTKRAIIDGTFGGDLSKENAIAIYERHNQAVRDEVPAGKLLVFNAKDGWAPLCEFLGVPVPDAPYPRTNSTDEFRVRAELS